MIIQNYIWNFSSFSLGLNEELTAEGLIDSSWNTLENELSSCEVTITHTGTLSHDQAHLGNVVGIYTLLTHDFWNWSFFLVLVNLVLLIRHSDIWFTVVGKTPAFINCYHLFIEIWNVLEYFEQVKARWNTLVTPLPCETAWSERRTHFPILQILS